ncbi:hypothetical protein [Herbidospora cretacea]|uniref:hypothetical protein n=1 Tax=Herbidospora cretacea TaxID=28444 RepID=UPI0012FA2627|nr:hypothetical protein [Herbidospora cretacea]
MSICWRELAALPTGGCGDSTPGSPKPHVAAEHQARRLMVLADPLDAGDHTISHRLKVMGEAPEVRGGWVRHRVSPEGSALYALLTRVPVTAS